MKRQYYLKIILVIIGVLIFYSTSFSQESRGGVPISWQDSLLLSNFKTNLQVVSLPNLNN